jgi:small-conductance mechanosensitive channel
MILFLLSDLLSYKYPGSSLMDLNNMLSRIQPLLDNIYFIRIATIFIYLILAKAADLLIDKVLKKLTGLTRMSIDDRMIDFAHKPICWTVFWLGVIHAIIIEPLASPWNSVLPSIAKSIILMVWMIAVVRAFNWIMQTRIDSPDAQGKIGKDVLLLIKNVLRVIIIISGLLWILTIWKISLTPLFASAGIAGIAIALAAKDTLSNFFGGISIFMDRTYKIGDYIIVDTGERGEVIEIGIRSTRIKTRDDVMITIPNSILANSKIINESAPVPRFRIRVPFGVAYESDLEQVEATILEIADNNPNVSKTPEPRVRLRSLADSSVNFELLCWLSQPSEKGREIHALLMTIHRVFGEKGIAIPFPQRDIHLVSEEKEKASD